MKSAKGDRFFAAWESKLSRSVRKDKTRGASKYRLQWKQTEGRSDQ